MRIAIVSFILFIGVVLAGDPKPQISFTNVLSDQFISIDWCVSTTSPSPYKFYRFEFEVYQQPKPVIKITLAPDARTDFRPFEKTYKFGVSRRRDIGQQDLKSLEDLLMSCRKSPPQPTNSWKFIAFTLHTATSTISSETYYLDMSSNTVLHGFIQTEDGK